MVTITLDRERRMVYEWAAIKRLKVDHGLNFLDVVSEDEWWFDPVKFSAVLWCGLVTDDPALTVEQVDGMIRFPRLKAITEAMLAAVAESLREGEQGTNPPTPPPA